MFCFRKSQRDERQMEADKSTAKKTDAEVHQEVLACLTAMAQGQTVEVLAAQDGILAKLVETHEEDVASFKFECQRWGDFLALMVERGGTKVMQAIDISAGAVQLLEGHAPDRKGEVSFYCNIEVPESVQRGGSGGGGSGMWTSLPLLRWPKTGKWTVTPIEPKMWLKRARIDMPQTNSGSGGGGDVNHYERAQWMNFVVPTGARVAEDDTLHVERSGATLYCPAGLGEQTYAAILAELKNGAQA